MSSPRRHLHRWTLRVALGLCLLSGWAVGAGPWRAGERNSEGWRWLSPAERVEHQRRLRGFSQLADCKAYLAQHHTLLAQRARRAGHPFEPRRPDSCDDLQQRGHLR